MAADGIGTIVIADLPGRSGAFGVIMDKITSFWIRKRILGNLKRFSCLEKYAQILTGVEQRNIEVEGLFPPGLGVLAIEVLAMNVEYSPA